MKNFATQKKVSQKSTQRLTFFSDSAKIGMAVHSLDAIIKVGKLFPVIFLSLAGLNIFMATNDFLSNSMAGAIFNSVLGIGDVLFLAQMRMKNHSHFTAPGGQS